MGWGRKKGNSGQRMIATASLSATMKMRGAQGEEARGGSLYLCILYIWVCASDRGRQWGTGRERKTARIKKKWKKPKGHRAKTGSPPNQFGLAESGCTICHQSTFAVLSALPSIYRGHPLCTLLRNKTRRRNRNTEEKNAHTRPWIWSFSLCRE